MNPLVSEYMARIHGEELAQQAARARRATAARAQGARPLPAAASPLRRAVGLRLVSVGLRLAGAR